MTLRNLISAAALLLLLLLLPLHARTTSPPIECVLRTPYVELRYDEATARWTLATRQGLPNIPSDDDHPLTGQAINTYCVVRIDNTDRKFGAPEGRLVLHSGSASSVTHSWTVADVEILQTLTLTNSPLVPHPASLKIRYWVRNKGKTERRIGLRIVLDTFLGANDNAAFLVPGLPTPVTTELILRGNDVPDWWVAWDDPVKPFNIAGMVFTGPDTVKPDSIAFASARRLRETLWDFRADRSRNFRPSAVDPPDAAVALTWDPIPFQPGDSNGIAFHFGVVEPSVSSIPPSDLVLIAPFSASTETLSIMAAVRNNDSVRTLKDPTVSLTLPPGTTVTTTSPDQSLPDIPAGEQRLASWRLRLPPSASELSCSLSAKYGTGTVINRVRRTVRVTAEPQPR